MEFEIIEQFKVTKTCWAVDRPKFTCTALKNMINLNWRQRKASKSNTRYIFRPSFADSCIWVCGLLVVVTHARNSSRTCHGMQTCMIVFFSSHFLHIVKSTRNLCPKNAFNHGRVWERERERKTATEKKPYEVNNFNQTSKIIFQLSIYVSSILENPTCHYFIAVICYAYCMNVTVKAFT